MRYWLACVTMVTLGLTAPYSSANTEAAKEKLIQHYVEPGRVDVQRTDDKFQIAVKSMPMSSKLFLMSVCLTAALEYYLNKFSVELRRIGSQKIEATRHCR